MDIIKLYGKGIENFVPDLKYKHDFYLVANEIIENHQTSIIITPDQDDICFPCKFLGKDGKCADSIDHIPGIISKNDWNQTIDKRIMEYSGICDGSIYSAQELCEILYAIKERIFDIWKEESSTGKQDRYHNFCKGAIRYLSLKEESVIEKDYRLEL